MARRRLLLVGRVPAPIASPLTCTPKPTPPPPPPPPNLAQRPRHSNPLPSQTATPASPNLPVDVRNIDLHGCDAGVDNKPASTLPHSDRALQSDGLAADAAIQEPSPLTKQVIVRQSKRRAALECPPSPPRSYGGLSLTLSPSPERKSPTMKRPWLSNTPPLLPLPGIVPLPHLTAIPSFAY